MPSSASAVEDTDEAEERRESSFEAMRRRMFESSVSNIGDGVLEMSEHVGV